MTTTKNPYLTSAQLKAELEKCLNCPSKPCQKACPVKCCPQEFISYAKSGDYKAAVKSILSQNPLGEVCGLICPDKFCQKACTRQHIDASINIPKIQASLLKNYRKELSDVALPTSNGKRAAVIGSGPAGLSATATLMSLGWKIDVYEKDDEIGGALNLIPESRLPKDTIKSDIKHLYNKERVTFYLNSVINDTQELLKKGYDGIIVAVGEQSALNLNIEGECLCVCYKDYLRYKERYQTSGKVAIIGGGNVAFDCAITAKNMGAESVEMFVRRRLSDMRISKAEYLELIENEINVNTLASPEKIIKKNDKLSLIIHKNHFLENKLTALPNTSMEISGFDLIIRAIGSRSTIEYYDDKIIYAGDCLSGGSTAVEAIASGREAALKLNRAN